jgi:uroporphyrinogen-III synthase
MGRWLVTRPQAAAEATAAALAERGHQAVIAPLTRIVPRTPRRLDTQGAQAVVVTSANGATRLADLPAARALPVVAVGAATAEAASAAGASVAHIAGGDGEALARTITDRLAPQDGPLIWLRGDVARGRWRAAVQTAGFAVRQAIVYAADPVAELPDPARAALAGQEAHPLQGVLLFSPRAASLFVRLTRRAGLVDRLAGLTALCLSAAVADAAGVARWAALRTAAEPTEAALLDLMMRPAAPLPPARRRGD